MSVSTVGRRLTRRRGGVRRLFESILLEAPPLPVFLASALYRAEAPAVRGEVGLVPGLVKATESAESLLVRVSARMDKARSLLEKGVPDEAGEEVWRAVVDAVNAAATALWGVAARSHRAVDYLAGRVADYVEKTRGKALAEAFRSAYGNAKSLHSNFYEPGMDPKTVKANMRQAERIIRIVREIVSETRTPAREFLRALVDPTNLMILLLSIVLSRLEPQASTAGGPGDNPGEA
jgi:hypothetical protein